MVVPPHPELDVSRELKELTPAEVHLPASEGYPFLQSVVYFVARRVGPRRRSTGYTVGVATAWMTLRALGIPPDAQVWTLRVQDFGDRATSLRGCAGDTARKARRAPQAGGAGASGMVHSVRPQTAMLTVAAGLVPPRVTLKRKKAAKTASVVSKLFS